MKLEYHWKRKNLQIPTRFLFKLISVHAILTSILLKPFIKYSRNYILILIHVLSFMYNKLLKTIVILP
jgi:hypothetical protein